MRPYEGRDNTPLLPFVGKRVRNKLGFKKAFRSALHEAHDNRCAYCGGHVHYGQGSVDHVHPQSFGGTDDVENLVLCCRSCNSAKCDGSTLDLRWCLTIKNSQFQGIISGRQARNLDALGVFLGFDSLYVFHYERYGAVE